MTACPEPVLLIGFNRPDLLREVIDRVRAVRPARVYLAVDGPRPDRTGEAERVLACQQLAGAIDWGAEVRTLFRPGNLGCGRAVSGAITWFLEHEERGIILEDDILPGPDFFPFVADLLQRHQHDEDVAAVTGTNFVPPAHQTNPATYRFSRVPVVWGWGTWRRAWQDYRFDVRGWRGRFPQGRSRHAMGGTVWSSAVWSANFDLMARQAIDTWDLQFVLSSMAAGRLTATPAVNLVENVGFRPDATHTLRRPDYLRPVEPWAGPWPKVPVVLDERADRWLMREVYGASPTGLAGLGARAVRRRLARS